MQESWVWVRVWELCQGPGFRSERAPRIGRGSDPGAQVVSGKVRGPDRIRCTRAGIVSGDRVGDRGRGRVR